MYTQPSSPSEIKALDSLEQTHKHFANHKTDNVLSKGFILIIQKATSSYRLAAFKSLVEAYEIALNVDFQNEKLRQQILSEMILTAYYVSATKKEGYAAELWAEFEKLSARRDNKHCVLLPEIKKHILNSKENKVEVDANKPNSLPALIVVIRTLMMQLKYASTVNLNVTTRDNYVKFLSSGIKEIVAQLQNTQDPNRDIKVLQDLADDLYDDLIIKYDRLVSSDRLSIVEFQKLLDNSETLSGELPAAFTQLLIVTQSNMRLLFNYFSKASLPNQELWDTLETTIKDNAQDMNQPPLSCVILATQTLYPEVAKRACAYLAGYYRTVNSEVAGLWKKLHDNISDLQTRLDLAKHYRLVMNSPNVQINLTTHGLIAKKMDIVQTVNEQALNLVAFDNWIFVLADIFYLSKGLSAQEAALQVQTLVLSAKQANQAITQTITNGPHDVKEKHTALDAALRKLENSTQLDTDIDQVFLACDALIDSYQNENDLSLVSFLIKAYINHLTEKLLTTNAQLTAKNDSARLIKFYGMLEKNDLTAHAWHTYFAALEDTSADSEKALQQLLTHYANAADTFVPQIIRMQLSDKKIVATKVAIQTQPISSSVSSVLVSSKKDEKLEEPTRTSQTATSTAASELVSAEQVAKITKPEKTTPATSSTPPQSSTQQESKGWFSSFISLVWGDEEEPKKETKAATPSQPTSTKPMQKAKRSTSSSEVSVFAQLDEQLEGVEQLVSVKRDRGPKRRPPTIRGKKSTNPTTLPTSDSLPTEESNTSLLASSETSEKPPETVSSTPVKETQTTSTSSVSNPTTPEPAKVATEKTSAVAQKETEQTSPSKDNAQQAAFKKMLEGTIKTNVPGNRKSLPATPPSKVDAKPSAGEQSPASPPSKQMLAAIQLPGTGSDANNAINNARNSLRSTRKSTEQSVPVNTAPSQQQSSQPPTLEKK